MVDPAPNDSGRELLTAYRDERGPSPEAAERLLAALRRDTVSQDMSPGAGPLEHVPEARSSRTAARRWIAPALLLAAAAGLAALVLRPQPGQRHARGDDRSAVYQSEPGDSSAVTQRQPAASAPILEPAPTPEPPAESPAPVRPRREVAPAPSLADEMQQMRPAQLALAAGDPRTALARLDSYARAFPDGRLREEHLALRAIARCELGDAGSADDAAEFLRERPQSMFAERVRGACKFD